MGSGFDEVEDIILPRLKQARDAALEEAAEVASLKPSRHGGIRGLPQGAAVDAQLPVPTSVL